MLGPQASRLQSPESGAVVTLLARRLRSQDEALSGIIAL
jgi:hypothetical protein